MSDIVELLTERRKFRYAGDCKCGKCCLVPHEMLCSAIDEIKRLRRPAPVINDIDRARAVDVALRISKMDAYALSAWLIKCSIADIELVANALLAVSHPNPGAMLAEGEPPPSPEQKGSEQ